MSVAVVMATCAAMVGTLSTRVVVAMVASALSTSIHLGWDPIGSALEEVEWVSWLQPEICLGLRLCLRSRRDVYWNLDKRSWWLWLWLSIDIWKLWVENVELVEMWCRRPAAGGGGQRGHSNSQHVALKRKLN